MDNESAINKLIEVLEAARQRPMMFLGYVNEYTAHAMLLGIQITLDAFEVEKGDPELRREIVEQRGWEWNATGGLEDMRSHGLTDEQIADELLAIKIDVLKAIAQKKDD